MQSSPDFTFHHGGLSVPNLDEGIAWYRDVLGFELELRIPFPPANAELAYLVKGLLRIELFEVKDATPLPADRRDPIRDLKTHGTKHLAFKVDDLDAFLEHVRARGADVALVIRETVTDACFLRDSAGNLLEFICRWR